LNPLTTEQQQIVANNIGLVGHFIKKFRPPTFIRICDYESELMLALCKAVATWKPDGGAAFSTWTFHKFMGARSDMIRRTIKVFRNEKQINEEKYGEVPGPENDPYSQFELTPFQLDCLKSRVELLDENDKMLIGHQYTACEIAEKLGLTPQTIRHRRRVLLRKLAFRLRQVFPKSFRREHCMGNGGVSIPDSPHGAD